MGEIMVVALIFIPAVIAVAVGWVWHERHRRLLKEQQEHREEVMKMLIDRSGGDDD